MKNKRKNINVMDERQSQITQRAIACGFAFLIICLLIVTIYDLVTTDEIGWELFGIIGASAVVMIARRIMGDVEQPKDYKGRPLPTGNTRIERRTRVKSYAVESLISGAVFGALDILLFLFGEKEGSEEELAQIIFPSLSKELTVAVTAIIAFAVFFAVSFLFEYLVGELYAVRRYNKMISQLDEEEDA